LLAAVSVAVAVPAPGGANRTAIVHDLPGPRLVPVHVSAVMVNAADPASATFSAPVADPPELASVNACEAGCPTATCP
jgi:hypothetical protein